MNKKTIINILKKYKKQNEAIHHIVQMGIYGSAARDELNEKSDIDIVVVLEKPDLFDLVGIQQDLKKKFSQRYRYSTIQKKYECVFKKKNRSRSYLCLIKS